ncbi:MAG: sugar phosphate isomerase/epimerase [Verrucomicrobia bacterium]|nr:sugar phosphate isomerase/epimerase [Verrucomicrobiota bacterium]
MRNTPISRREFIHSLATAGTVSAVSLTARAQTPRRNIKLGFDNFSIRAMGWKASALIDYAASLRLDVLFITDLDAFENLEDACLEGLRAKAADKGLQIYVGTWSICPTSAAFKNKWGTAEEHLALGIRVAKAVGSPIIRCILGSGKDRASEGGIERHIEATVKVCKACRGRALDAGVKIAVENHAGDMRADELVRLIEAAGRDYVGATMDSGNATWALEDPMDNLEKLGPYALATGLRDSALWEYEDGVRIQWTAMGAGQTDWQKYFDRYAALCPQTPACLETISGFNRDFPCFKPEFWTAWPNLRAGEFAKLVALARRGQPRDPWKAPAGKEKKLADQEFQKAQLEQSLKYCRETLGLGLGI